MESTGPGVIILAGGKSSRMGTDKALLRLKPDGPRLVELVLASVQPVANSVVVSTNRPRDYEWLGLPLVGDNYPGMGPLAGLEAGLSASAARYNLVVACDMPFLQPGLLGYLLDQARQVAAVIPLNAEGGMEPLCAVYTRDCLPVIREALTGGSLKMTGWLSRVNHRLVPAEELRNFDPDLRSFNNLNSPQDLMQSGRMGF